MLELTLLNLPEKSVIHDFYKFKICRSQISLNNIAKVNWFMTLITTD